MEPLNTVRENIKAAMRKRGLNQSALAKKLEVSPSAVSQMLSGNMEVRTLFEIATAIDVSPAELVGAGGQSLEDLRLECIVALLRADRHILAVFRDTFPNLFEAATDEPQSGTT